MAEVSSDLADQIATDKGETMGSLENIQFLTAIIDLLNALGGGSGAA